MSAPGQVTQFLNDWTNGDLTALDKLTPLVYDELRRLAASYMNRERIGHTLQPTALVHEAYMRLVDQSSPDWRNRSHFFGVAAQLMRQILVDHVRRHRAVKRDGGERITLNDDVVAAADERRTVDLIALDDALSELARIDARKARIVELRFFAGLTVEETAKALDISLPTVHRDIRMAETWLFRRLNTQTA
jgi:RNA polymerase sigma factor (TIGR02999 family)